MCCQGCWWWCGAGCGVGDSSCGSCGGGLDGGGGSGGGGGIVVVAVVVTSSVKVAVVKVKGLRQLSV